MDVEVLPEEKENSNQTTTSKQGNSNKTATGNMEIETKTPTKNLIKPIMNRATKSKSRSRTPRKAPLKRVKNSNKSRSRSRTPRRSVKTKLKAVVKVSTPKTKTLSKTRKYTPRSSVKRSKKIIKKKIVTKNKSITVKGKRKRPSPPRTPTVPLTKENKVPLEKNSLNFFAWSDDSFVIKTLEERGWVYKGEPVHNGREDYPNSVKKAVRDGSIDNAPCLFWADDHDGRVLAGLSENHMISSIPNADKALTKVYQQKMFGEYYWFPKCFTLPKERQLLVEYIQLNPQEYWICKPRDSYGGFGMCVYSSQSEEFEHILNRRTTFVVQRYMSNPYLFAGKYKFHIRAYMIITNARNPLRSYLWKNAQVQFCTHVFDLTQIGKKNFNKYCHISNYKVNNEKKNKRYLCLEKDGIGAGSEWAISTFFDHMNQHAPGFSEQTFWKSLTEIAKVVSLKLTSTPLVKRAFKTKAMITNHFEIYGLDILMDDKYNLEMTEANTQPGLDDTNPVMPNGKFNAEIVKANDVTAGIINDCITLLGIDGKNKELFSPFIELHC